MALGPAYGGLYGARYKALYGPNNKKLLAGIPGVSRDSSSLVYVPATNGEWITFLSAIALGIATPTSIYLCQDPSGNLTDVNGANTLTAAGTPLYLQTAAGWARQGVGFNAGSGQRFGLGAGVGPNPATTSVFWLWFHVITAIPGVVSILSSVSNGATSFQTMITTASKVRASINTVTADGLTNAVNVSVLPVGTMYDRVGLRATVYTPQDKIVDTFAAGVVDGLKGLSSSGTAYTGQCVYGALWVGANAEAITDLNIKTLLNGMGATVLW